jgi:hypothetical protein
MNGVSSHGRWKNITTFWCMGLELEDDFHGW